MSRKSIEEPNGGLVASSELKKAESEGIAISPWAVFDYNDDSIFVVNAYPVGRPAITFAEKGEVNQVHSLMLGAPDSPVRINGVVMQKLIDLGVVAAGGASASSEVRPRCQDITKPFMEVYDVSVDAKMQNPKVIDELGLLLSKFCTNGFSKLKITFCSNSAIETLTPFLETIQLHCSERGIDQKNVKISWRTSLAQRSFLIDEAVRFLDKWPRLQVIVEDTEEVQGRALYATQRNRVQALVKAGFQIVIAIPTRYGSDLPLRIKLWEECTGFGGVRIEPITSGDMSAKHLHSTTKHSSAHQNASRLSESAALLGISLLKSEPWSSIISNALLPGIIRSDSSIRGGQAFLSSCGNWAMSRRHAKSRMFSTIKDLFSAPSVRSGDMNVDPFYLSDELPNCAMCKYSAMCDGFWDSNVDWYHQTGDSSRAIQSAHFNCNVRADCIGALVAQDRKRLSSRGATIRAHASFKGGKLKIT